MITHTHNKFRQLQFKIFLFYKLWKSDGLSHVLLMTLRFVYRQFRSVRVQSTNYTSPPKTRNPKPDLRHQEIYKIITNHSVNFPNAHDKPNLSVIIPIYGHLELIYPLLQSLSYNRSETCYYEIILVDDKPSDQVSNFLDTNAYHVLIQNPTNVGFLKSCNIGASYAKADYLLFLNTDTFLVNSCVEELLGFLENQPRVGVVGPAVLDATGVLHELGWQIQSNGWGYPISRDEELPDANECRPVPVDAVTGACMMTPRSVFVAAGGFDELFSPAFYEEFDYAFRLKYWGLKSIILPSSYIYHYGTASYESDTKNLLSKKNQSQFFKRHVEELRKHSKTGVDYKKIIYGNSDKPLVLFFDLAPPQRARHAGDVTLTQQINTLLYDGWRVAFWSYNERKDVSYEVNFFDKDYTIISRDLSLKNWLLEYGLNVDLIWMSRPLESIAILSLIKSTTSCPIVYYTHDVHHLRLQSEAEITGSSLKASEAAVMLSAELEIFRRVNMIFSPNADETQYINNIISSSKCVDVNAYYININKIDECLSEENKERIIKKLVFVGGFPHTPNVDAVKYLVEEIYPIILNELPEVHLYIVGYAPPPEITSLACNNITVTGRVDDLSEFYSDDSLALIPLRFGAGVKGKTIEAMSRGVPVVGSSVAFQGIAIEPGVHGLVGDSPQELAQHVINLIQSPTYAFLIGVAAQKFIGDFYNIEHFRTKLLGALPIRRCCVCGQPSERYVPNNSTNKNVREQFTCSYCYSLRRQNAVARVILNTLGMTSSASINSSIICLSKWRIHEMGFSGHLNRLLRALPKFSFSETGSLASMPEDVRLHPNFRIWDACEGAPPFTNIDLLIAQDVLEHVIDIDKAINSCAKSLSKSGVLIFTTPIDRELKKSIVRASLIENIVVHLETPMFHGDPVLKEGALVCYDFGCDLNEIFSRNNMDLTVHQVDSVDVFVARCKKW